MNNPINSNEYTEENKTCTSENHQNRENVIETDVEKTILTQPIEEQQIREINIIEKNEISSEDEIHHSNPNNHENNDQEEIANTETNIHSNFEANHHEVVEDENEIENNGPNNEITLSSLISTVSNTHLMSEESIEALRDILCSKENIFYHLSMKGSTLSDHLSNLIKYKAKIAENTIGEALSYYHQRLIDSELGHLDKLMKILKSNKRDMFLRKITAEENNEDDEFANEIEKSESLIEPTVGHLLHEGEADIQKQFQEIFSQKHKLLMKRLLPEYNSQYKFIRFQLNQSYEVYLRVYEEKTNHKPSLIDKIPNDVLQNHILIYFNSFDLFKLREVCSEWRDLIRGMWHVIFKREMMEQVIAADLCNDIEMNFKLMSIKSPFYHKFGILMKAITEVIEWDQLLPTLLNDDLDVKVKLLVLTFFKMIGMNVGFEKISDFQDEHWNLFKETASSHLKIFVDSIFNQDFYFDSSKDLDTIKENFLDYPDISSQSIRQMGDKNLTMFQLFLRQLLVFAQLKNYLGLAQSYVIYSKDKLKEVSKEWPSKKGFLEGAYKILLFKFVQIKNGEVTIAKDEEDEHKHDMLKDIQNELNNCMNITSELHDVNNSNDFQKFDLKFPESTNQEVDKDVINPEQHRLSNQLFNPEIKNISEIPVQSDLMKEATLDSNQFDRSEENKGETLEKDGKDTFLENLITNNISKIIELRKGKDNSSFERFIKGESADYTISKNGSETRLFLDDAIKIELLIQKFIKLHLLKHIQERTQQSAEGEIHENEQASDLKEKQNDFSLINSNNNKASDTEENPDSQQQ